MKLSSSFQLVLFHAVLAVSFCYGDQIVLRNLAVPSTRRLTASLVPRPPTTSALLRQIPRGGSTNSVPLDSKLEESQKLPSLFPSESDNIYDRYAACLAATEGLRRIRDQALQSQQQQCMNDPSCTKRNIRESRQFAIAIYAENASSVIEAMGMPVSQFNSIGKIVCNDATLKQKVLEQAYLYRLKSNVALDEIPLTNSQISKSFSPVSKAKFHTFCESVIEVEKLRRNLVEELKHKFQLEELPSLTSQASLRPLLDSNVRSTIDSFPMMASKIVHRSGLNNDEFNELLRRTNASTFFRWKVLRNIRIIEREQTN